MAFKFVLICTALVQVGLSQCIGSAFGRGPVGLTGPGLGLAGNGHGLAASAHGLAGYGNACASGTASTGGGFSVTSASPIVPTGVSLVSENAIEGALNVGGNLPLLGSVALEGAFPSEGAGAVSYGCGDENVAITSESTGAVAPKSVAPTHAGTGLGLAGNGLSLAKNGLGLAASGHGLAGCNNFGVNGLGFNGFGRGQRGCTI